MFDRTPSDIAADREPSTTVPTGADAPAFDTPLARLLSQYDALLARDEALSPEAGRELTTMAAIYDLDIDRPHATIWKDLKIVLSRNTEAAGADSHDAIDLPAEPLTLLVVEDDPDAAMALTEVLTEAGHSVVGPFHDGDAAQAAAGLHSIDAALVDINLSGKTDGVALARALKSRWDLPVVFLSGDVTAAARHADLAVAFVTKPYTGRQVLDAVARTRAD